MDKEQLRWGTVHDLRTLSDMADEYRRSIEHGTPTTCNLQDIEVLVKNMRHRFDAHRNKEAKP